ncbi:hypothetical protein DM47_484 [Burkholderia mallei]|nr:hypothetical protein DM75_897 [Burkholderia mallei]KGX79183.1 hypothetical protein Y033_5457 [Burkholderia pseudomallei MSHR435]KOS86881.1 hypothetical protein DM45_690 [Burkholderia mallei]KOS97955.1 hypothetical protein DM50_651 [Burkholderia mallei]KOT04121.1 hypothetical protein DM77_483 [Burkholderia mallei]
MVVVPAMSTSATAEMAKVSFTVLPLEKTGERALDPVSGGRGRVYAAPDALVASVVQPTVAIQRTVGKGCYRPFRPECRSSCAAHRAEARRRRQARDRGGKPLEIAARGPICTDIVRRRPFARTRREAGCRFGFNL